jgi:sarcosine oxidase subunit delta
VIIPCPFCGDRDLSEFIRRGEVPTPRPQLEDGTDAFVEHVYVRTNPAGVTEEYWYHEAGCRQWQVVRRDTRTHVIEAVSFCSASRA